MTTLTNYELELLLDLGQWYVDQVRDAIRNKPIKRKSLHNPDGFEAVVNASGRLAESIREELTDDQLEVYALGYIEKLVFGQPPGERVELSEIESWLAAKGLDYNPNTVQRNIRDVGTSIWNQYNGENSGLLSDIPIEDKIQELKKNLLLFKVDQLSNELAEQFVA